MAGSIHGSIEAPFAALHPSSKPAPIYKLRSDKTTKQLIQPAIPSRCERALANGYAKITQPNLPTIIKAETKDPGQGDSAVLDCEAVTAALKAILGIGRESSPGKAMAGKSSLIVECPSETPTVMEFEESAAQMPESPAASRSQWWSEEDPDMRLPSLQDFATRLRAYYGHLLDFDVTIKPTAGSGTPHVATTTGDLRAVDFHSEKRLMAHDFWSGPEKARRRSPARRLEDACPLLHYC